MQFEFSTATRIIFGAGSMKKIGSEAKNWDKNALLVHGLSGGDPSGCQALLTGAGLVCHVYGIEGEPTLESVLQGLRIAKGYGCDLVVAFGGGSAIDTGKAISALMTNPGDIYDYLEVVGKGKPLTQPAVPFIAIPTTAGTGAEVTKNAVILIPEKGFKVSLRSPFMLPRLAIVDPELTYSLPPSVTASTGMDALTQLIEPYVSLRANPITDGICIAGMRLAAQSLRRVFMNGQDREARENMAAASLMGGLALANAGLGAVHGFASPIGGMFPAPHGAVCARLLPGVFAANVKALQQQPQNSTALERYYRISRILTGQQDASLEAGEAWLRQLSADLHIRPLSDYGIATRDLSTIAAKAMQASSMKANPVELSEGELMVILTEAL